MRSASSSMTRELYRDGERIREFDVQSAATVMSAFIGGLFLIFFLAAFLPWLLSKGMTAAIEGLMNRIGFGTFHANTIWSWLLVLAMFAVFTAFIVMIATGILALYNLLSQRTGLAMRADTPPRALTSGRPQLVEPDDDDYERTFDELYAEAQRRNLRGRSTMTKDELQKALRRGSVKGRTTTTRASRSRRA